MPTDDYFSGPGPERRFHDFLAEGKFMIQRSKSSGNYNFYPRTLEPGTGAADLEWVEASGDGVVYATTVNRQRPEKGGDYNICLVDLAGSQGPSRGLQPGPVTLCRYLVCIGHPLFRLFVVVVALEE